jgi:hypothetical protein
MTLLQTYRVVVLPIANTWMSWSLLHKMSITPSGPLIVLLGIVLLACIIMGLQVRRRMVLGLWQPALLGEGERVGVGRVGVGWRGAGRPAIVGRPSSILFRAAAPSSSGCAQLQCDFLTQWCFAAALSQALFSASGMHDVIIHSHGLVVVLFPCRSGSFYMRRFNLPACCLQPCRLRKYAVPFSKAHPMYDVWVSCQRCSSAWVSCCPAFVCTLWKGGQGAPFCRTCRPSAGSSTQPDICVGRV